MRMVLEENNFPEAISMFFHLLFGSTEMKIVQLNKPHNFASCINAVNCNSGKQSGAEKNMVNNLQCASYNGQVV